MRLRPSVAIPLAIGAAAGAAYATTCLVVYGALTRIPGGCRPEWLANGPSRFEVPPPDLLDTAPYWMPEPAEVRITSRDPRVELAGWWVPAARPHEAPAVVVVHGLAACRHDHAVLLPAGMLHRHGFSVLLIDLRDHGESTELDRHHAGGTDEFEDVLGAWDWLRDVQRIPATRIGLLGISLGAATVLIATGEEPRVAAVWADSSYADVRVVIRSELRRSGYPTILDWGGVALVAMLTGDPFLTHSPLDAVRKIAGRPVFLTHGAADPRLAASYALDLAAALAEEGGHTEPWIVPGAGHTQAMILQPAEYERRLVAFFSGSIGRDEASETSVGIERLRRSGAPR